MGIFGSKSKGPQEVVPLLIVEDLISFPHSITPLYISNKIGSKAVDQALADNRKILIAYKKKGELGIDDKPYLEFASLCHISQVMKLPSNSSRVLVDCEARVKLVQTFDIYTEPRGKFQVLDLDNKLNAERGLAMRNIIESFKKYASLQKKINQDILTQAEFAETPHRLVDIVLGALSVNFDTKAKIFVEIDIDERMTETMIIIESELQLLELKTDISGRVKKRMEQNQKDFYLQEQIKELNKELGKDEEDGNGFKDLEAKIKELDLSPEVRARLNPELKRLTRLAPLSPEAGILRTWLELIVELPWKQNPDPDYDLKEVKQILDIDHYNLQEGKEKILEFLAAKFYKSDVRSPIICFVGPPGTGKTSLARSIAKSLKREFVRMSLGGVRDEAEIRGHRRTYVGALPGKIIQGLKKAKVKNPIFLLDEIDKISSDHRGDPSAALLEVLDPEQNTNFVDHYLELGFDLSKVLFIATANNLQNVPWALRDRMELIEVPGYTPFEKQKIAIDYLLPKLYKEHGLDEEKMVFSPDAINTLIDAYTNEAGVRSLERNLLNIIRKILRQKLENGNADFTPVDISKELIFSLLTKPRIKPNYIFENLPKGLTYGLAWTENGGTVLPVEVGVFPGKGELLLTGSLGDVMKESARIALSVLKRYKDRFDQELSELDLHIHVPEGATPKDGPSAGITLATALMSALSQKSIKPRLAMTGEITLTGRVLPVGGIREKTLAAERNGFNNIIMPKANFLDAQTLPEEIKEHIIIHYVETIDEVLLLAFADN